MSRALALLGYGVACGLVGYGMAALSLRQEPEVRSRREPNVEPVTRVEWTGVTRTITTATHDPYAILWQSTTAQEAGA